MTVAEKIKSCRRKAGLTQQELANRLGVSCKAVAAWEGGYRFPAGKNVLQLGDIFHASPAEFYEDVASTEDIIDNQNPVYQRRRLTEFLAEINISILPEVEQAEADLNDAEQSWRYYNAETGRAAHISDEDHLRRCEIYLDLAHTIFRAGGAEEDLLYILRYADHLQPQEAAIIAATIKSILAQRP